MFRDLGRGIPDLENFMQENSGLIFRSLRQEKGTQTQTFRSGYLPMRWVFQVKGWVCEKSSVCPTKPRETKLFGGISQDFCQDIPEASKKFERKKKGWVQVLARSEISLRAQRLKKLKNLPP